MAAGAVVVVVLDGWPLWPLWGASVVEVVGDVVLVVDDVVVAPAAPAASRTLTARPPITIPSRPS